MYKKITVQLILFFLVSLHINVVCADSGYTVTIDNNIIDWTNAPEIYSDNGEIMIPIKFLTKAKSKKGHCLRNKLGQLRYAV